ASTRVIASYTDLENRREGDVNDPGVRTAHVSDERFFHVIGLRVENKLDAGMLKHRFGAEVRRLWGDYDYASEVHVLPGFPFPGSPGFDLTRATEPSPEGYESSGYWDVLARFNERWAFQGGVRIDTQTYDGSDDGEQWSPRISVLYTRSPQTHLRASLGRFVQFQGINELRVETFRKEYRQINPRFENIFDPLVLLPEAEFDRVRIAPDSARATGLELMARLRPHGSWSGWLSYTWSRAEDRIDGDDVPRSWDQRQAVNLG